MLPAPIGRLCPASRNNTLVALVFLQDIAASVDVSPSASVNASQWASASSTFLRVPPRAKAGTFLSRRLLVDFAWGWFMGAPHVVVVRTRNKRKGKKRREEEPLTHPMMFGLRDSKPKHRGDPKVEAGFTRVVWDGVGCFCPARYLPRRRGFLAVAQGASPSSARSRCRLPSDARPPIRGELTRSPTRPPPPPPPGRRRCNGNHPYRPCGRQSRRCPARGN